MMKNERVHRFLNERVFVEAGGEAAFQRAICAKIVARQWDMPDEPFDIFALCDEVDGLEWEIKTRWPADISGAIVKVGEVFRILINGREAKTRQRFTAAHELAHFILHRDKLGRQYPENVL